MVWPAADALEGRRLAKHTRARFDLAAIEKSLLAIEAEFDSINVELLVPRDPMHREVVANLVAAYAYVDSLLDSDIDLLARGNSQCMLQTNRIVLWGPRDSNPDEQAMQLQETALHFYDDRSPGSVRALMNHIADHGAEDIWTLAAGIYVHILTAPQLFIEGNHRTGAAIVSHVLVRAGLPPLVLTRANARAYFDISSTLKGCRKRSLRTALEIPKLRRRLARFLEESADARFLRGDSHA